MANDLTITMALEHYDRHMPFVDGSLTPLGIDLQVSFVTQDDAAGGRHERGGRECFLEVRASNTSAYRLYERYGFNEVGRRRGYYPSAEGREDALVMACTLID